MKQLLTVLAILFTILSWSQSTGSIVGKITDKELNNEPLPFANVQIKGTAIGTTTDIDGLYEIGGLNPGSYTVTISFIGYESLDIPNVMVESGKVTTINTGLGAGSVSLDEVVLTTTVRRDSESAVLLDQKKAIQIKQSISAEELTRKGVSDAAGAIAKISGISRQEGSSNVYVRGLGDRYQNTTMNGLTLPSNDINKKNIDLGLFSSDVIQNVGVSKAYSSNYYADFSAGNVDISSKEYTGKGFLEIGISSGLNSHAAGQSNFMKNEGTGYFGFYNRYDHNPFAVILSHGVDPDVHSGIAPVNSGGSISFGKTFHPGGENSESSLSIFGTVSFGSNFRFLKGSQANYGSNLDVLFPNVEKYIYSTTSTALGNITYKINKDHKIKFSSLAVNSSSDEVGYYGTMGQGFSQDLNSDIGYFQMNSQFNQDLILVNQLSGEHNFNDKWNLEWGVGYNRVDADEPDRKRITLNNYDRLFDNDPNTNPTFGQQNNFNNQRYFQKIGDEEINSRINLTYNISDNTKLNFGYNGRTKDRHFENQRYGYKNMDQNYVITDPNKLNDLFNLDNYILGVQNNGQGYQTHVFNPLHQEASYPGLTPNTSLPGRLENTYDGSLNVNAAYVSFEFNLGDKWLIVPGFRTESFNQSIEYNVINLRPELNPGTVEVSESLFLPNLNVKYSLNEDMNLRLSASQTVSFPEFKEMAPFVYEGVTQRIGGNPDILGKRAGLGITYNNVKDISYSKIYNFDLKYEWYPSSSEIISIAGFAKQINDPVNLVVANDATGTQRYFRTGESARIIGAEIEIKKNIITDEYDDAVLSFGFNASYMYTEQDLYDAIDGFVSVGFNKSKEQLQGASPFILNADISYSPTLGKYKPVFNAVGNYFSDRIYALGSGQLGNIMEKGVPTIDFIWRNEIGENLQFNLYAKNLLDPTFKITREISQDQNVTLEDYNRGIDFGIELKYKF